MKEHNPNKYVDKKITQGAKEAHREHAEKALKFRLDTHKFVKQNC